MCGNASRPSAYRPYAVCMWGPWHERRTVARHDIAAENGWPSATGGQLGSTATLARTSLLSSLSPPSPDPAGITWDAANSRLIVSDSEVEEMSIYQNVNMYELNLAGNLTDTGDITTANPLPNVSNEPTGLSLDPVNGYLFI